MERDQLVDVRVQEAAERGYVDDYVGNGLGRRRHFALDAKEERRGGTQPGGKAAGDVIGGGCINVVDYAAPFEYILDERSNLRTAEMQSD